MNDKVKNETFWKIGETKFDLFISKMKENNFIPKNFLLMSSEEQSLVVKRLKQRLYSSKDETEITQSIVLLVPFLYLKQQYTELMNQEFLVWLGENLFVTVVNGASLISLFMLLEQMLPIEIDPYDTDLIDSVTPHLQKIRAKIFTEIGKKSVDPMQKITTLKFLISFKEYSEENLSKQTSFDALEFCQSLMVVFSKEFTNYDVSMRQFAAMAILIFSKNLQDKNQVFAIKDMKNIASDYFEWIISTYSKQDHNFCDPLVISSFNFLCFMFDAGIYPIDGKFDTLVASLLMKGQEDFRDHITVEVYQNWHKNKQEVTILSKLLDKNTIWRVLNMMISTKDCKKCHGECSLKKHSFAIVSDIINSDQIASLKNGGQIHYKAWCQGAVACSHQILKTLSTLDKKSQEYLVCLFQGLNYVTVASLLIGSEEKTPFDDAFITTGMLQMIFKWYNLTRVGIPYLGDAGYKVLSTFVGNHAFDDKILDKYASSGVLVFTLPFIDLMKSSKTDNKSKMINQGLGVYQDLIKKKIKNTKRRETDCSYCGCIIAPSKCGKCKNVSYCDMICQRSAWPTHKNDCK